MCVCTCVCIYYLVYNLCIGNTYEHLEERQKRRRKEQIRKALQTLSSNLSSIDLKLTTAHFETIGSHEKFDVFVNDSTPDDDCVNQSITASINYLMLKHGVPISFYHELSKRFKKLPRTHEVCIAIM